MCFLCTIVLSASVANAQPSWELYQNKNCGISLMHPYPTDKISSNSPQSFLIASSSDQLDPDSLNMNITIKCIDERIPITEESMNLTMAGLREELSLVTYEENAYNSTIIDNEIASTVSVGGPTSLEQGSQAYSVTEVNHNNMTFVITLESIGDDGISGFFNNFNYLKDNVLNSIKFIR